MFWWNLKLGSSQTAFSCVQVLRRPEDTQECDLTIYNISHQVLVHKVLGNSADSIQDCLIVISTSNKNCWNLLSVLRLVHSVCSCTSSSTLIFLYFPSMHSCMPKNLFHLSPAISFLICSSIPFIFFLPLLCYFYQLRLLTQLHLIVFYL